MFWAVLTICVPPQRKLCSVSPESSPSSQTCVHMKSFGYDKWQQNVRQSDHFSHLGCLASPLCWGQAAEGAGFSPGSAVCPSCPGWFDQSHRLCSSADGKGGDVVVQGWKWHLGLQAAEETRDKGNVEGECSAHDMGNSELQYGEGEVLEAVLPNGSTLHICI